VNKLTSFTVVEYISSNYIQYKNVHHSKYESLSTCHDETNSLILFLIYI